jgi:HTH-type transcriptional regulator, glycine betaine synthesis regulator
MWEREVKMNMEAIEEAQSDLQDVLNDGSSSPETLDEAKKTYDQLEDSKTYYRWLQDLVENIQSGEIFEFLPKEKHE